MVSVWISALKEYNNKKGGSWCVPKKDTNEYNEVKKIMDRLKAIDKPIDKPIDKEIKASNDIKAVIKRKLTPKLLKASTNVEPKLTPKMLKTSVSTESKKDNDMYIPKFEDKKIYQWFRDQKLEYLYTENDKELFNMFKTNINKDFFFDIERWIEINEGEGGSYKSKINKTDELLDELIDYNDLYGETLKDNDKKKSLLAYNINRITILMKYLKFLKSKSKK